MSKAPTQSRSAPASSSDSYDELTIIVLCVAGLFLCFALFKFFAWLSIYLYTPFTLLPLTITWKKGPMFGAMVFILYAVICATMHFLLGLRYKKAIKKSVNPERSNGFLYLSAYWVFIAGYLIVDGNPLSNGFFSLIYYICDPSDVSAPWKTCNANIQSMIMQTSFLTLIQKSFLPNLMFVIPLVPELLKSFVRVIDHPKNNAMGAKTVQEVIRTSCHNFAHLNFYSKIDPRKYPTDGSSPFALLRQSRQFATEQNLIEGFIERPENLKSIRSIGDKQVIQSTQAALTESEKDSYIPVISSERFEHEMLKQLGKVWTGEVDDLSPAQIMLLGITLKQCCTIEREMSAEEAAIILNETKQRMDKIWIWLGEQLDKKAKTKDYKRWPDGYDLTKLPPLTEFEDYQEIKKELGSVWFNHPVLKAIVARHAYVNTVILDVIITARKVGVLQPSSTRWMRLYDRSLFALIQNAGRPSIFAENMGSVSHYYAEKRNKRKLLKPEFQAAYEGFSTRLSGFLYTAEDVALFRTNKLKYTIDYRGKDKSFTQVYRTLMPSEFEDSDPCIESPDVQIKNLNFKSY